MQSQGIIQIITYALPLLLVFMFYIQISSQKKREKQVREMLSSLKVGSEVVTVGGVLGKILNIKDDEIVIETSVEKTQIKILRWAVKDILNKAA